MATRLPSGSYRSQVLIGTENGKRVYKSFIAESADAADLAALQYKAAHKDSMSARSFSKSADSYLATVSSTLSPTTIHGYSATLRMLKAHHKKFCAVAISAIDRFVLQELLNEVAKDHAPKTVQNYYRFISSVLRHHGIRPPDCVLPQKERADMNIPDAEVINRLLEAVEGTEMEVPVKLGVLVPMREGEIFGASLEDLSPDNVLHIHKSLAVDDDGNLILKSTKNMSSDRYVELPTQLADKIRKQGYFCNIPFKHFSRRFSETLERAGIEHFRFHDLRHAFVSISHAAGIPDAYIMARGGWATPHTMTNVYRHTLDSNRKKIEATVNQLFSELFKL